MMGMVMCVMVECCGTRNSYKACVIGFSNNMYLLNYCDGGGDFYSVTLAFRQTTGDKADGGGCSLLSGFAAASSIYSSTVK